VLHTRPFQPERFEAGLPGLRQLAGSAESVRHVPGALAELGVRLVVVEPLPRTRLDGAAFRLSADQPVIALSLRYDRIDWFWHTLAHELVHIRHGDKRSVDANLVGDSRTEPLNEVERLANDHYTLVRRAIDFSDEVTWQRVAGSQKA